MARSHWSGLPHIQRPHSKERIRQSLTRSEDWLDHLSDWRTRNLAGVSISGTVGGIAAYAAAYSPSLLPRSWLFQGLVAALGGMFGYQVGQLASGAGGLLRETLGVQIKVKRNVRDGAAIVGMMLLAAGLVGIPLHSIRWQRRTAEYCHTKGPNAFWAVASTAAASAMFALFMLQWRATASLIDWTAKRLGNRFAWAFLARMVATLVVLATLAVILDVVVVRGVIEVGRTASERVDRRTPVGVEQPTDPGRSGSPASRESWATLGLQGKRFVSSGPSQARIEEVTGKPAMQPLRVYASLNGRTIEQVVAAVIAEMDRVNAWERKAICMVTTTGRGNVNEWAASALEYLLGGDSCIASMQYSGLPSAITLAAERTEPIVASRLLFEAVEARVRRMPQERQPLLLVNGESLGAYGSSQIFKDIDDMLQRLDGALWLGTPSFTPMHAELLRRRSPSSSVVDPVIDNGRHIRFASNRTQLTADEFGRPLGEWEAPRIVFLQNDTDPVVWWTTPLLWRRPVWMDGHRDPNTPMGRMTWYPFVTYWQVLADMPVCRNVGEGYGHKYNAQQVVPSWAGVLGMDPEDDYSAIIDALTKENTLPLVKVFGI